MALLLISSLALAMLLINGGKQVIGTKALGELSIRNLGVSGIGTAPTIIALTLYSLLPLVRNTYADLHNVDAAAINSGRSMGMTPSQILLQIELPIASSIMDRELAVLSAPPSIKCAKPSARSAKD